MRAIALLLMMTVVGVMLARASFAHEGHDHGGDKVAARDLSGPAVQADGAVFVPKPMQRLLEIRTTPATPTEAAAALELPAQVIPDPNSIGRVQSARNGRLEPPKEGFPVLGQRVSAGQILGHLDPTMDLIDRLDIEERMRSLDQQARLAQTQLERYSKLSGVVPQRQIDEARIELEGLQRRRRIIEPLLGQKDPLRAPIEGVIARANAVAGQVVQGQDVLFEIIDPARLWVEASAFDAGAVGNIERASAVAADGTKLELRFMGRGYALRQQAVPVQFRVEQPPATLTAGMPVTVLVQSGERSKGVLVPNNGIVRGPSGQEFVWTHPSAERFIQKPVRTRPLDAASTLVMVGVEPGSRVVTTGAEMLNQIR
jgi:RND family efflux transporter MFP subunit